MIRAVLNAIKSAPLDILKMPKFVRPVILDVLFVPVPLLIVKDAKRITIGLTELATTWIAPLAIGKTKWTTLVRYPDYLSF